MPNPARGEVRKTNEGFSGRITLRGRERKTFPLPTCRDEDEAQERANLLATLARDFRRASVLDTPDAPKLLEMAAGATPALLKGVLQVARELVGGDLPAAGGTPAAPTFEALGDRWTSGALHNEFPDHVREKRSSETDGYRLGRLCEADVGGATFGSVPIDRLTLAHADAAMAALPADLSSSSRRQYAQLISKVLKLAVYPVQCIQASPLPVGWLPKVKGLKVTAWLYPSEERALLDCTEVPLEFRLLYGFLAREGLRLGEAVMLRWADVDLGRGVVRLDANKTDDPRAWAVAPGVAEALAAYKASVPEVEDGDRIFATCSPDRAAEAFREHLALADITRIELFEKTKQRRPVRAHDLRATFVTLALAAGRSEAWVADRTGHRSSTMINRYRRAARTAAELNLGTLDPLVLALPDLSPINGIAKALAALSGGPLPRDCPSDGTPGRIRTCDQWIRNPSLYPAELRALGAG